MKQPLEVLKFSQRGIVSTRAAHEGVERVAAHAQRARISYWKGIKNPFVLTEASAMALTEIEKSLDCLFASLDAATAQLKADEAYYKQRISEAQEILINGLQTS